MTWLEQLKILESPETHATKPTKPTQTTSEGGFVGFVASLLAPTQNSTLIDDEELHPELSTSETAFDRFCWPNSEAMNEQEIETFTNRVQRWCQRGLSHTEAEQLAQRLVQRDRHIEDGRSCLECAYLSWSKQPTCCNGQNLGIACAAPMLEVSNEWVVTLQRCAGFKDWKI